MAEKNTKKENNTSNIEETLKNVVTKSTEVSKDVFTKAGNAVQNFSDKSVLKIEIKQLQSKIQKLYTQMGSEMSSILNVKGFDLKDSQKGITKEGVQEGIKTILDFQKKINDYSSQIEKKQALLEEKKSKKK